MSENSPNVQRRSMQPLPSRKKHILLALCTVAVILGSISIITNFLGQERDARSTGSIAIAPPPLPPASDTLSASSEALPDLLAGDVEENINPTEIIAKPTPNIASITTDALGNPIASAPSVQTPQTVLPPVTTPLPSNSGPHVITIDGKPIDGSQNALVPAPISGLTRLSSYGQVPAISRTGVTPLSAYKRPFSASSSAKTVSIIIGGLGVNAGLTQQAIDDLPPEVTLSFAAHSSGLRSWVSKARAKGHEVLIELPLESHTFDASETGAARALMASRNTGSNPRNLDWLLSRSQGAFGVTNYNGDLFLNRADAVAPLFEQLRKMGLSFVFDGSVSAPSLSAISASAKLPYAAGYNLIDRQADRPSIDAELSRLSETAKLGASPIGVGFTYPDTITAVKQWTNAISAQGLTLAPASYNLR